MVYVALLMHSFSVQRDDFDHFVGLVQFGTCQQMHCIDIHIVDDLKLEDVESFNVSLERSGPDGSISLDLMVSMIEISDNDG